jgi:hypothetical protein
MKPRAIKKWMRRLERSLPQRPVEPLPPGVAAAAIAAALAVAARTGERGGGHVETVVDRAMRYTIDVELDQLGRGVEPHRVKFFDDDGITLSTKPSAVAALDAILTAAGFDATT